MGGAGPQEGTSGNFSLEPPAARDIKAKWSTSVSCLEPFWGLSLSRINSKPVSCPRGPPQISELSAHSGMLQACLTSFPSRTPLPQLVLALELPPWLFLCPDPLPISSKGSSSRSLPKLHISCVFPGQLSEGNQLSYNHVYLLFFNQRLKFISIFC